MFLGQAVAGLGFGAAFTAALGLIVPIVQARRRAGVVAAIYGVSYLGLGVPSSSPGSSSAALGIVPTVGWWPPWSSSSRCSTSRLGDASSTCADEKPMLNDNQRVFLAGRPA